MVMRLMDRYASLLVEMVGLVGAGLSPEGSSDLRGVAEYEEIGRVIRFHYRALRAMVEAIGRDVLGKDQEPLNAKNSTLTLEPDHYRFYRRVENELMVQESLKDEMVEMVLKVMLGTEVDK